VVCGTVFGDKTKRQDRQNQQPAETALNLGGPYSALRPTKLTNHSARSKIRVFDRRKGVRVYADRDRRKFDFFSREENQRQHSKPGSVPRVAERKKHAIAVVE